MRSMLKLMKLEIYFRFDELDPPGTFPPRLLNLRGSKTVSTKIHPNTGKGYIPFRLIRARFRVPFPPSQKPLPALPTSTALQIPQFSGR